MKKVISFLLTAALLVTMSSLALNVSALQYPKITDKLSESYNKCFSKATDDDVINVTVYYSGAAMTQDEINKAVQERCGIDPSEFARLSVKEYDNLTEEEKRIRQEKSKLFFETKLKFLDNLAEQNSKPFLRQMGIKLQYSKELPIYNNRRVFKYENSIEICLTKAEILKAAGLDYAEGILCNRITNSKSYKTILFENTLNWDSVYVYSYSYNEKNSSGEYPGTLVEDTFTDKDGREYMAVKVPRGTYYIILSNGEGERTTQIDSDKFTYYSPAYAFRLDGTKDRDGHYNVEEIIKSVSYDDPETPGKGNFVLLDNYGWKQAYIYALDKDGNELYGAFPGKKAKRYLDYGGYQFQVTVPEGAASIVLSNSQGERTEAITWLNPYHGYSLAKKNASGEYTVEDFWGYLPEPETTDIYDPWYEPDPMLLGDVNDDGALDVLDAVMIQKFTVQKTELSNRQTQNGDYNDDDVCDVLDATAIQKALVGKQ